MSTRLAHGTEAWFEMVGRLMCEAAARAALPPDLNFSLVERYLDGVPRSDGFVQGLRFDIRDGQPCFRVGALPDEEADVTVEVTAAASRKLNTLYANDPRYAAALARLQASGELRIHGDLAGLGVWFGGVHDPIVERTA
jgi:hypothetical protein